MLTNGKKIWGIWNGGNFICDPVTQHILTYDDVTVANEQMKSMFNRDHGMIGQMALKIISEGHNGYGGVSVETKG